MYGTPSFSPPTFANQMYSLQHNFFPKSISLGINVEWHENSSARSITTLLTHTRTHTLFRLLKDRTLSFSKIPGRHATGISIFCYSVKHMRALPNCFVHILCCFPSLALSSLAKAALTSNETQISEPQWAAVQGPGWPLTGGWLNAWERRALWWQMCVCVHLWHWLQLVGVK